MAIPESQLDTWSHQGSITQSSTTYATVKRALEAGDTKYAAKSYEVYLQGSYCNDTNIYAESDVDVVIQLNSTFHYNLSALSASEAASFEAAYPAAAGYRYNDFKADVLTALQKSFGVGDVSAGKKAIKVKANGGRRSADVVVTTDFRRYSTFPNLGSAQAERGICLFASGGEQIVNYPKQHSQRCTIKHQATNSWYKPMVRILKNMRGKLVENGSIKPGTAPSYFLEGLMFNVPNDLFGKSYGATFVAAMNWILQARRNDLICANGQFYLVRDNSPSCWPCQDCGQFLDAVADFWNHWN
jgi:hypothetical protein